MKTNINTIGNLSSYPELNLLIYSNPKYWDCEDEDDED